jgi:hypothetical protein
VVGVRVVGVAHREVRPSAGFSVYQEVLTQEVPPMALSQSVASELLEAFRAGEGVDLTLLCLSSGRQGCRCLSGEGSAGV